MANLTYTKLAERNVSFQLLRTNPKLTTNVKLTIDSDGSLWLNSINANQQLADQKYKRFAINENSSHEINLYKFYDNGKTPSFVAYELGSTISKTVSAKDLKDQYDFDLYTSGAKYLNSRQYSEKFSYLAPLYLDQVMPSKFIIFKIPGASNYTAGQGKTIIPTISIEDFATDLFKNATIVKTFDLSHSSKIGTYLQNITNNPMFNKNPLYVNYKANEFSVYRGPSIKTGTYVELPEQLSTVLSRALPILTTEQFITQGFERNMIVHPKIINMEFLFNDDTSETYEFNRYFGFYCNDIDLETFDIDLLTMFNLNYESGIDNDQVFPVNYNKTDDISLTLTNSTGVKLRGMNLTQDISDLNNNRVDKDSLFFPYLKTKDALLHLIKSGNWNQTGSIVDFKLDDKSFDLGLTFGPTDLVTQETANYSDVNSKDTISIDILTNPNHLDVLRIYHPSGSKIDITDINGKFDDLVFVRSFLASTVGYTLSYYGGQSTIYVNGDRDLNQISQSIIEIVDALIDTSISGVSMKSIAFIQINAFGSYYGTLKVRLIPINISDITISINDSLTTSIIYADGGFLNKPHPVINIGNITKLTPLLSDIAIRTNLNWSSISRLCNCSDSIISGLSNSDIELAISDYKTKATIQLTDDEFVNINYDKIEIRNLFKPTVGLLSFFEIMDFDFSTYLTNYSKNLLLDLYKDFYIPENINILDFTKYTYQVIGDGTISINGIQYSITDLAISGARNLIWQNTDQLSSYIVVNGTAILIYGKKLPYTTLDPNNSLYPDRLDISYYDETNDAVDYVGPFSLKTDHNLSDQSLITYPYREKYLDGNISSEYHAYLENFNKDFAIDGRVIPYINKWGIIDSTDSRDNPYRLNSDIVFGKDNFGPSHKDTAATPEKMTHEWFYIESDFGFTNDIKLTKNNFNYFNESLSISDLITSPDYFENYFTYLPTLNGIEIGRPQYRYSILNKNAVTNQYETLFKGAMFKFYELNIDGTTVSNSTRFENYKFSILLKPIKEDSTIFRQPVKYRVIENTNSKSITLVIELVIGSKDKISETVLVDGWNTLNVLDQTNLFSGNFKNNIDTYSINTVLQAIDETHYYNLINGASMINAHLGETIEIVFGNLSTIIATAGSDVYDAVLSGKISTGDKLGERIYTLVDTSIVISLIEGFYYGTRIQADFEDVWIIGSGLTPATGEIISDDITFSSSSINLQLSTTSSANPIIFTDLGGLDQTTKLASLIITGSPIYFSLIYGNSNIYEEVIFSTNILNSTSSNIYDFDIDYVAGAINTSLIIGDSLLFKAKWFIPSSIISTSIAQTTFSVEHKVPYYDSIYGDYRISFNDNNVSDLTHSFLYFAKDKKYNNKHTAYSTIKLSRGLNLSSSGITLNPNPYSINTILLNGLENYDVVADSEINQISNYFAPMYIIRPGEKDILLQINQPSVTVTDLQNSSITADGVSGANQDKIMITTPIPGQQLVVASPTLINLGDSITYQYLITGIPTSTTASWINGIHHFQIFGGEKYFEKVFEKLSFGNFIKLLDANQSSISWESYTNGILTLGKPLSIEVITADEILKSTMVQITPELVQSGTINQIAGFTISEIDSQQYSINRYSAEYEVLTNPIAAFKYNFSIGSIDLTSSNSCLNPIVDNFFMIPEFEYIKYSKTTILDLENSQTNSSVYPLIGETPIDRTTLNMLSSSWDYNYHFDYINKVSFNKVSGSKRITEDYSFVSKLLNLPMDFIIEEFTSTSLSNSDYLASTADIANIVYSTFGAEVRFKLNLYDLIAKYLSNTGLRTEFEKFFKYTDGSQITFDSEFLGDITFESYLYQYCIQNLIQLYQVDAFEFYELDDRTIQNNLISFEQINYDLLGDLGYSLIRSIRINNTKSKVIEGAILIKPNTGVKLVPKLKIKFI